MTVAVTGAAGFVGAYLVRALRSQNRSVVAAVRPADRLPPEWADDPGVTLCEFDLTDGDACRRLASTRPGALVHLAAVASVAEARQDPVRTWEVNAVGTVRLLEALASHSAVTRALVVSSGEVYGAGPYRPRTELDPVAPTSSYAASKLAAETAAREIYRRAGLPVVIARPFAHVGPGQGSGYVVPAFIGRLRKAAREGAREVATGNLEPVRDFLDVRDVVRGYLLMLESGEPGEVYNVARGTGIAIADLFAKLAALIAPGVSAVPDRSLARPVDVPHLVGDPGKLRDSLGWLPEIDFDRTLSEMVNAETN